MTYEPLERVRAWAQQEIGGAATVTSAITLPASDGRYEIWLYLARTIDGATRYSIEVLPPPWSKYLSPLEQACCVDAAGYFDFWNTNASNRAKLTVLNADTAGVKLETELNTFSAGDVGKRFALRLAEPKNGFDPGVDAKIARIDVVNYVDAKTIEGRLVTQGSPNLEGQWTKLWARMQSVLNVGARLEGTTLDALADGAAQTGLTVAAGDVTMSEPVARGWIGLPCPFDLVDMPLAQGSAIGTAFGGQKKVDRAWLVVEDATAGLEIYNPDTPDAAVPMVLRSATDPTDRPPAPVTGYIAAFPKGAWSETGQIGVRQAAPYPLVVLGVIKEIIT